MLRRLLSLLAVVGLLATACAGGGDQTRSGPSPERDADGPTRVDRLTIAVRSDFGPLNLFAQHEEPLTELVYDKLLAPSPYVEDPQPWLAEGVSQPDPTTWEVDLRDDVTWHDGERFTAADVAFTVEYFKEAPTGRWTHHVSEVPEIERVEVVDDTTARFHCAYACPFLGPVTLADLPMLPEHVWEGVSEPRQRQELPVGTGPYELVSYDSDSGYEFEANGDYFAGEPRVEQLVMPIITDPSTTFSALRSGEIDTADREVPPELVEQFRGSDDISVVSTHRLNFPALTLNYERAPFDQPRFREALAHLIDRGALLETVWLGQGREATRGYMHPDTPWSAEDVGNSHQPDRARRLLDELGYTDGDGDGMRETSDGQPLSFTISVAGNEPTHVRAAELIAEQAAAVGVEVTVRTLDPGALGELFSSRDFDTYILTHPVHGTADPTQFIMSHRSGFLWNLPEVAYPEMADLIDQWMSATTIEGRTDRLFAMERLFDQQPTAIPLYYPDGHQGYRSGTYAGWIESPGYGIVHKWSLLPREVACEANALVSGAC